jgi:hypothetical protein
MGKPGDDPNAHLQIRRLLKNGKLLRMDTMEQLCLNCGQPISGTFCSACGQKTSTSRFTMSQLAHDFFHGFFHVDRGFFYTAKELMIRPGPTLKNYLAGQRIRHFNPFTFIVIVGGLNGYLLQTFHWQGFMLNMGMLSKSGFNQEIWNSSLEHFTVRLLVAIPLYSLMTYLLYYRSHYTFAEHLIANTYLRAEFHVFMIIIGPLQFLVHAKSKAVVIQLFFVVAALVYLGWGYAGWLEKRLTAQGMLKGFAVALLSTVSEAAIFYVLISGRFW